MPGLYSLSFEMYGHVVMVELRKFLNYALRCQAVSPSMYKALIVLIGKPDKGGQLCDLFTPILLNTNIYI